MGVEWKGFARSADERGSGDSGRPVRDSLFLAARMTVAWEETATDVRIRNLSERGLMVEPGRVLAPGTRVALEFRGVGRVTGRIAWYAEGRAGVALDEVIDPSLARRPVSTRPAGRS